MAGTVRAQQRAETRRALLLASRRLFAAKGYAAVGLSEIVATAGVTKGALYHHFDSKSTLFQAVLEQVQTEVGERVAAAADAHPDPWTQLLTGCETFLTTCTDPEIQRIMLIDGPAVLGWHTWRAMDAAASAHHLAEALELLVATAVIKPQPIEPLTHLLSGAMNEAALWLTTTDAPDALNHTTAALHRLLASLRNPE
ncbi:TetR/AcrR family transcriptional regulator [Nocardia donostiensis]|uniref:TetR family transcriptional regulator n=1 Tax=Nocardia donostiensis TaxID=1538463 RepID=A0A1W0BF14_9NOCA|nr:TetR/AcrR family transcriptional regulator [Nocardia donostiensis]ONM47229.1 TetR family transcriptional regulator [Nocardia donostiensis]OQS16533.1 TetR family transcriptional regulator [Nocardia donostiensis]OQS21008.1 TetR family transcriptional regulator [Nocardia donostiensis]